MNTVFLKNSPRGFTIIELMIAIVIVAILAAIGYNSYFNYIRASRVTMAQQYLQEIMSYQSKYYLDHKAFNPNLPTSFAQLPPEIAKDFNRPVIWITNSVPPMLTVYLQINNNSPILTRHNPSVPPYSLNLAINSTHMGWYERDACDCSQSTECTRDANRELTWEEGRASGGGGVLEANQQWSNLATPSQLIGTTATARTCTPQ